LLKLADVVVITKGDIVSQAEREVSAQCPPSQHRANILFFIGITVWRLMLSKHDLEAPDVTTLRDCAFASHPCFRLLLMHWRNPIGETTKWVSQKLEFSEAIDFRQLVETKAIAKFWRSYPVARDFFVNFNLADLPNFPLERRWNKC
jgi:hypothetical protein